MTSHNVDNGYLSLCYHYIRNEKNSDPFPRILGNTSNQFKEHIKMFFENFQLISPSNAVDFSYNDYNLDENKIGLLLTFDDGLSDHFNAAKILAENNIQAIFFIPTCILKDNLPANPIIIHYCIAKFGITKFLAEYELALKKYLENYQKFLITFTKGVDDPNQTIAKIKNYFKYQFEPKISRKILLQIYETTMLEKYPNSMEIMHLTNEQISEMYEMGHSIGTHTHSHVSVGGSGLSKDEFIQEIVEPKNYLEKTFGKKTDFMSYPFGKIEDCLSSKELIMKTNSYKLVFTVSEILNLKSTSPLELGRYMPTSKDASDLLYNKMNSIIDKTELK